MDIYKARWENAKRIAEKINSYLDAGYFVFDEDGNKISTIKEYNLSFKKWKIVRPEHVVSLI